MPLCTSSDRIPFCRSYPIYPWLMAEQTDIGAAVYPACRRENSFMAVWIMPTCGALPWVTDTCYPFWMKPAITLAVPATAAFCSGRLVPRALCPKAMTIRFLAIFSSVLCMFYSTNLFSDSGIFLKLL